MVSRPAMPGSPHPMIWTPGGVLSARSSGWVTSCTSPRPATILRRAPAARTPQRRGPPPAARTHGRGYARLVFPNLITSVATTDATVTDNQMTAAIDDDLARKT